MDGIRHIDLGAFPGDEILLCAGLPGHFVDQGDALGLCGEHIVIAVSGNQLQKLPRAGHCQLRIAKADKCADIQIIRYLANGKFPLQSRHLNGICHSPFLLKFPVKLYCKICPCIFIP